MSAFLDPLFAVLEFWRWTAHAQEALACAHAGAPEVERVQRRRLQELVHHARRHSRFYAERYADLPDETIDLATLPPTGKAELMRHFEDWVTDPEVRLAEVERFVADPRRIGERFLGRYTLWTSSGSTGRPGIYVQDEAALSVYDALLTTRFPSGGGVGSLWRMLAGGGRLAMVAATGGHFAGVVSWERLRRLYPWIAATSRAFSLLAPFERLLEELNDWRPSVLAAYPTTLLLLGEARRAGRLRCDPEVLWSGGETLAGAERAEIERCFGARVVDGYGASECMHIAFDCGHGALHVNADWVVVEPIDSRGRPVPPGEASASVLITNLANRVQPLIRYDLGDSVRVRPTPCACGSPFPAIEVDGRRDDILVLETADGRTVALPPLAVATVVEEGAGVHRFQVVQTGRRTLHVRFEAAAGRRREAVWRSIAASLSTYLARQGLEGIELRPDPESPRADPVSGKLREVIGRHARRPDGGHRP